MPPRHAYWTILIDNAPTAFRAREREDLVPTLNQLRRTNKDVLLKWFGRGKLWDTPEAAETAGRETRGQEEKRGRDWRPGGTHKDPRDRFKKGAKKRDDRPRPRAAAANESDKPADARPAAAAQPWREKPDSRSAGAARPWRDKPHDNRPAGGARPWRDKPRDSRPAGAAQPWRDKPRDGRPAG
ncbi:MAG: hypothetical protein ABJA98_27320, partial [Acidobacteriota bacterium]